jgi:UDP-3-O-[3-hydroxymyristoyl] glucosamine N-acyltransferase
MMVSAAQIASFIGGRVSGNPEICISGPGRIEDATRDHITFLANPKYRDFIYSTRASIVIVGNDFIPERAIEPTLIYVDNVYAALSLLMEKFNTGLAIEQRISQSAVIHPSAVIAPGVCIDHFSIINSDVSIGSNTKIYGQVFIGNNTVIGENCTLYPGVKIYHGCKIGNNCVIHANVVIGSDGFGFAKHEDGSYKKIPQTGNVVIEDDVEIGSNTVIDRASIGSTLIHKGVKLDNLIQIAHNVSIGERTAIAAQSGVAGSTNIGSDCVVGGQVGIVGHLSIANKTMIQAQSGVASSVKEDGRKLYGYPAMDYTGYLKSYALFRKLPTVIKDLQESITRLQSIINKKDTD